MTKHDPRAMARARVHYHSNWGSHVLNLHFPAATGPADAASYASAVCSTLRPLIATTSGFDSADYIAAGQNVANPMAGFVPAAGTNTAPALPGSAAMTLGFIGRTNIGTRARLFLFCDAGALDRNYKIDAGEWGALTSVITWLNGVNNPMVALDGLSPTWKNYATVHINRHWEKVLRKGAG